MEADPHDAQHLELAPWQRRFVEAYLSDPKQTSLLVAAPGTGKTLTAVHLAGQVISRGLADATVVLSDMRVLIEQWRSVGRRFSLDLSDSTEQMGVLNASAALTLQSLRDPARRDAVLLAAKARKLFVVVDDFHRSQRQIVQLVNDLNVANPSTRTLMISTVAQETAPPPALQFDSEFFFDLSLIDVPETRLHIARASPSFELLRRLQSAKTNIDDLSWRDFEKLIAELLQSDGYEVQQMRGTKDGGVDVIATKEMPAIGLFKTLWQAKKQNVKNKVGISVIRELADTRNEFSANKAVIVTSSYLTSGALARVKRDNYLLGKVDRDELDAWIQRKLLDG